MTNYSSISSIKQEKNHKIMLSESSQSKKYQLYGSII